MNVPAPISTELLLHLVVPGDEPLPVDATLRYDAADPYAVALDIATGSDSAVSWNFSRELLTAGVDAPAGEGDVRIAPVAGPAGRRVRLTLSSPDGTAELEASLPAMVEFLGATYTLVPTGTESDRLDLDRTIAELLA